MFLLHSSEDGNEWNKENVKNESFSIQYNSISNLNQIQHENQKYLAHTKKLR